MVQWLRLHTPKTGGMGSIPGWGTKIPQAVWCSQKKRKRKVLTERVGEPPWLQEMVGQRWTVWQRGGELAAGSECKCLAFPPVLLLCSVTLGKSLSLRARWVLAAAPQAERAER